MNQAQLNATQWLSGQFDAMEALLQQLVDTDSNSYDKAGVCLLYTSPSLRD